MSGVAPLGRFLLRVSICGTPFLRRREAIPVVVKSSVYVPFAVRAPPILLFFPCHLLPLSATPVLSPYTSFPSLSSPNLLFPHSHTPSFLPSPPPSILRPQQSGFRLFFLRVVANKVPKERRRENLPHDNLFSLDHLRTGGWEQVTSFSFRAFGIPEKKKKTGHPVGLGFFYYSWSECARILLILYSFFFSLKFVW